LDGEREGLEVWAGGLSWTSGRGHEARGDKARGDKEKVIDGIDGIDGIDEIDEIDGIDWIDKETR